MNNKQYEFITVILIIILSISTLSCNLLGWFDNGNNATGEIEDQLKESGMILLRDVVTTKDIVSVSIEMTAGDSLTDQYVTWVYIFEKVLEIEPDAEVVVINLYFLGDSYLLVSANAEDIKAMVDGEIDQITFIDRLTFDDQRLPDLVLKQELEDLGWIVTSVLLTDDRVDIEAFPPEAETHGEIVIDWVDAMALAAEHAPDAQQISLHLLLIDTPNMSVTVNVSDLTAYQNGEMDEVSFLANWILGE